MKYIVIVCDECSNEKSVKQLENQLKTTIDQVHLSNRKETFLFSYS
jgi:hypothetical protein